VKVFAFYHSRLRVLPVISAILLLVLVSYQSAQAAFVPWSGDPNGSTDKLYWENGGSDFGLFGDPTISGNTFSFSPQNFIAISTNSIPADTCDTLVFDLIAKPGYSITEIRVSESGLYDVMDGNITVSGQFTIENLLTNETMFNYLDLSPAMPVTSGADTWTATAVINGFNWTHIRLSLYNNLYAYSDSAALVDKKTAGTPLIQIIPEPATICILGFGALSLIRRKKIISTNSIRRTVMKKLITICLAATMILAISGVANADWNPGDPAKWVQMPDLTTNGIDVLATTPTILADDFACTANGPITDIHIWGSWYHDILPLNSQGVPDQTQVGFRLSIYSDVPAGSTNDYSTPGQNLWERNFYPGEFSVRSYASDLQEGWYNPNTQAYEMPADSIVWQYNFLIDPLQAFVQEGSPTHAVIYWLSVEAFPVFEQGTPAPLFGWKTSSSPHFMDDAVWGNTPNGPWSDLTYPKDNLYEGLSMDLAFVITPEPTTICMLGLGSLALIKRKK